MDSEIYLRLFAILAFSHAFRLRQNNFFRKDYTLIEPLNNFYKLHKYTTSWYDAKKICEWEGAGLYYPKYEDEASIIQQGKMNISNIDNLWIGVSSNLADGIFTTIDGLPLGEGFNYWYDNQPDNFDGSEHCVAMLGSGLWNDANCSLRFPFVCKKPLQSVEWNPQCELPFTNYTYNDLLEKCYKYHYTPKSWTDAFTVCNSELSYLAVIDNQEEANILIDGLPMDDLKKLGYGDYYPSVVHLGFHNRTGDGWRTLKDAPIERVYSNWSEEYPRKITNQCGAMTFAGQLIDMDCGEKAYFICEHDIKK